MKPRIARKDGMDPDDATRLKIVLSMLDAQGPLSLTRIAAAAGLKRQDVSYHMGALIEEGIILPVYMVPHVRYKVQDVLKDDLLGRIEPLVHDIAARLDLTYAKDPEKAVMSVVLTYLQSITLDLGEQTNSSDKGRPL